MIVMIARPRIRTRLTNQTHIEQIGFWDGTLGYSHAVVAVCMTFLVGLALHATIGYRVPFAQQPLAWLLAALVPVSLVMGRLARKNRVMHWVTGIPVAVVVTTAIGILALIGGVVPASTIQERFHAESMWSCWPFLLLMELMVINLVGSVGKRCVPFTYVNFIFVTTHAGLAISIIGGAVSALLLERNVVVLFPGVPESKSMRSDGSYTALPFSIELKNFDLDSFPPILAVAALNPKAEGGVDLKQGEDLVKQGHTQKLHEYSVKTEAFLPKAIFTSKGWEAAAWKTAAPAAKLKVTLPDGTEKSGWVSCGSIDAPQMHLEVAEHVAIVMLDPRPKAFTSQVRINENGKTSEAAIKVNEPIQRQGWTIYQLSYDSKAGAASQYSTLEVVRDPGINTVYFGMGLLVLGTCLHLWKGVSNSSKGVN